MAHCEEHTEAVLLPAALVRELTASAESFRGYVFGLMAQRLGELVAVLEDVAFRRLDQRLAAYLTQRSAREGPRLAATHQEIASELGSSREAVSRLLKDLEGRGLLRIARGALELRDPTALARLAGTPQRVAAGNP
jgi:CRP/FNR family transcriptional regulator